MLISAVERQQSTVVEELQRRQEEVEEKANQMINHLQAELKALQTRGIEIVNLQATQNPLEMLQVLKSNLMFYSAFVSKLTGHLKEEFFHLSKN
ncbi:hypothetical protein NQD34_013411 [Periophthalmus magnuspinnatus]|nr:hypothetical protein NQD34_013411 [Periophthalmus magnuspinnatus]